ncbi:Uncharacterised protein [Klebsiella quasipneumoniae]|nr:Uncharacterised protein [Klebsiella quasipneumoniae]
MRCEYVVPGGVLNVDKLIFRRDLLEGEDLHAVFAAAWRMQQQVFKCAFTTRTSLLLIRRLPHSHRKQVLNAICGEHKIFLI